MSEGCPGDEGTDHEWVRMARGWHAAHWVTIALSTLWLLVTTGLTGTERLQGAATILLLAVAYLVLMQRSHRETGRRALVYLSIAVVAVGLACAVNVSLSMLLFVVYSQVWMFTPTLRVGTGFATALTLSALLGFLSDTGYGWDQVREVGTQMAVSLLFSVLLGIWVSRIIRQSAERAELITELEAARSELNAAERARGVMAERERLAREIHDTLAQGFTSIVMLAQTAAAELPREPGLVSPRLTAIEDVARENLAEARALVAAFSPVGLENSTLPDAVRRLAQRFAVQTGLELSVEIAEAATALSRDQEVVLLRAVQESLTNVRRHAGAHRVVVRLVVEADGARVEVDDDGVGFAPEEATGGYGLAGMRGRVAEVGGEMDVASVPGRGTRVTVRLPVAARLGLGLESA